MPADLEQVVKRIHPDYALLRTWPLTGGVSAQVTGLTVALPDGTTHKLLLREHGVIDRAANPHIARDEFTLLAHLHAAGLAVPKPYLVDDSGDPPYLIMAFIDGETVFDPPEMDGYLQQMAEALTRIHRVENTALNFLPQMADTVTAWLHERPSPDIAHIHAALSAAWPPPQVNPIGLLHGDYWPGNLLWQEGKLAAVVDWEDAKLGDPLADVANARLELLWACGLDAMHRFTDQYTRMMPALDYRNLPFWDLAAALRHPPSKIATWGLDPTKERMMVDHLAAFVTQAMAKI